MRNPIAAWWRRNFWGDFTGYEPESKSTREDKISFYLFMGLVFTVGTIVGGLLIALILWAAGAFASTPPTVVHQCSPAIVLTADDRYFLNEIARTGGMRGQGDANKLIGKILSQLVQKDTNYCGSEPDSLIP